jgi:hypothetical protein
MDNRFAMTVGDIQKKQLIEELDDCNNITVRYGLSLSAQQMRNLVEKRVQALKDSGRIEFGQGVLKQIILEFCDSPYITQDNYEKTIMELLDVFYYFKNESMDRISDEELILYMKRHFDGVCQGSIEHLSGTTLEELCRNLRYGREANEHDEPDGPYESDEPDEPKQ